MVNFYQTKWEMEISDVEAVLEKIWDLHDKLSDAIHSVSRTHFLSSLKNLSSDDRSKPVSGTDDDNYKGFVYVKDLEKDSAITEAKSLNAIRTALENLEYQLEFFHTVQVQQRVERDAAYARLEQTRMILALRLTEHNGKSYKVIQETLDFIRDEQESSCFVSPDHRSCPPGRHLMQQRQRNAKSNPFTRLISSFIGYAKKTLRFEAVGGPFGNAALFAISMIAVLHLHQATYKNSYGVDIKTNQNQSDGVDWSHVDVFSARG